MKTADRINACAALYISYLYEEHMRALRHRKGWKYQVAKNIFGTTRWDLARWDRAKVDTGLSKLRAKQAALKAKQQVEAAATTAAETSPAPSSPARPSRKRVCGTAVQGTSDAGVSAGTIVPKLVVNFSEVPCARDLVRHPHVQGTGSEEHWNRIVR
ncbi:hypothetical protein [Nonomuraea sediminis]|uniref:hypothetical protein n=1 Tax=Nonomuraea sediminis TaxID=2835864 RepID=UPI001BDDBEB2|nr:hypothetical protein [Nonomuraea sediminis]